MPDLAAFQRAFAEALMTESQAAPPFRSQAFAVYRNTAAHGAVEALRAAYPTVDMLVGEEMFTQVALDYRREQPPAGPVLSDYGAGFATFLAMQPWTCELPYVADVARLDRLWLDCFLAPDAEAIGGARTTIALHPAARFTWLATPAMTIWQAHRDPWELNGLEPEWVEEGALFTRPGHCIQAEPIDAAFYHLLGACAVPTSSADLIANVAPSFPQANFPELIQRGVAAGAFIIL